MDAVFLARLQFGLTAGFHFLFPPTTLGLSLLVLITETLHLRTKNTLYKDISAYLIRILGVVFIMGVSTGIALEKRNALCFLSRATASPSQFRHDELGGRVVGVQPTWVRQNPARHSVEVVRLTTNTRAGRGGESTFGYRVTR